MDTVGKIYISHTLMESMGLTPVDLIKVRVGVKIVTSNLVISQRSLKSFMISPQLARALNLKRRKPLLIRYDKNNETIHIGPTIGILVGYIPRQQEYYSPKSTMAELAFLTRLSRRMPGQIFVFTLNSINWSNLTTKGYVYNALGENRGLWTSSTYPLPDVVYDRVNSRVNEALTGNRKARKRLMNVPGLQFFNPSFLNKWKVHKLLSTNEDLHKYLPETRRLNLENLKLMLSQYQVLFLKPENGSLGSGIIKVIRESPDRFSYMAYKHGRHPGRADGAADLMRATRRFREGKPYIVQQGIELSTFKGANFDIRIIYQKNRNGEWKISKKFVRVAPKGSSIANLARGGRPERSKRVMNHIFKRNKLIIENRNDQIKALCQIVAETMEKASKKVYGELGLDIGIDKKGNPWLFEVNSKPRKTTETELSRGIIINTFKRPLEYSFYLAGFQSQDR